MSVPTISLRDFDRRRDEIIKELMDASTEVGFFTLCDHGIPQEDVDSMFAMSARFFGLPDDVKAKTPLNGKNAGWEKNTQVRPSTGTADQKESMQLQFARMEGLWPSDEDIDGFQAKAEHFMHQVQSSVVPSPARLFPDKQPMSGLLVTARIWPIRQCGTPIAP